MVRHAPIRCQWLAVLISISLVTWPLLALYWTDVTLPEFCSAGRRMPLSDLLNLAFVFDSAGATRVGLAADARRHDAAAGRRAAEAYLGAQLRAPEGACDVSICHRIWGSVDDRGHGLASHGARGATGCVRYTRVPRTFGIGGNAVAGFARQAAVPEPMSSPATPRCVRRPGRSRRVWLRANLRHLVSRCMLGVNDAAAVRRTGARFDDVGRHAFRVCGAAGKRRAACMALARTHKALRIIAAQAHMHLALRTIKIDSQ